jgi:ADP-heptose:LPS heptosyltransferase
VTETDRRAYRDLARRRGLPRPPFAVVHAGASIAERRWPARHFAVVADALAAMGLGVVLTGVTAEAAVVEEVVMLTRAPVVSVAGRTTLGVLAALVSDAHLVVCNDTGISHLAAALGTASVVLFGHTDIERWAPLDRERHRPVTVVQRSPSDVVDDILDAARTLVHAVP